MTRTLTHTVLPAFAVGIVGALGALGIGSYVQDAIERPIETHQLQPCEHEDSPSPCYWDAQQRGNGLGYSFIRNTDGTITHPFD